MSIRSADLRATTVEAGGEKHPLERLYVDADSLDLRAVLVDLSGWIEDHAALVDVDRFGEPDIAGGHWPAEIAREAEHRASEDDAHARGLRDLTEIFGAPVRCSDGEIGTVMDVMFAHDGLAARFLVVQIADPLPRDQKVVPIGDLASVDWSGNGIELGCTIERVNKSPSLHESDRVEGNWLQAVLAYYGVRS